MSSIKTINVFEEIARLQGRASALHKGHVAATIVKEHDVREVLVVMPAGANLHPHQPDENVVLHVLEGLVRVHLARETVLASAGMVLALEEGELHDVEAERNSAFLLVLPWPARATRPEQPKAALERDVDEAVRESIPASDPPAWTPTHAGPPTRNRVGEPLAVTR